MKTLNKKLTVIMLLALGFSSVYAQEYDDMYFSSKDRKQVKYVDDSKAVSQDLDQVKQLTQNPSENFSARTVNPEYIAKYQASSQENTPTAEFADDEYFVEDYNNGNNVNQTVSDFQNQSQIAVRDRYGNISYFRNYSDVYWSDPFLYEGTVFDPFYSPYYSYYRPHNYWLSGYSWSTPYTGWRFSFSTGFGWGNSWRYGNSFAWGGGYGYGYDPFYSPYCNSYYGYSSYGYPYSNVVVINNYETRNNRTYRRGPAPSRSGSISSNTGRRSSIASNSGTEGRSVTNGRTSSTASTSRARYINTDNSRNFDDAQSRYYRRSRTALNSSSSDNGSRNYSNGRSSSSNYTPDTRSYSNSRSSVRSSGSNSRSSSGNSNTYNSRSSRSNSSYSRPSNSNSRSNSSYTPSRSSSRSSSYSNSSSGSSSRSSYSRSSSSSSRSSSSSSRSSSSGSSSRSSSRRGN